MKSLPLSAAVAVTIQALTNAQESFSAHDVTRKLRTDANSGELAFTDLPLENVDGIPNTYRIDHNAVRGYVRASFGTIPNYERDNSRGYALYRPKATAPATSSYSATPAATSAPISYGAVAAPTHAFTNTPNRTGKVKTYVDRKILAGIAPTLKQIQSRLKGDNVTCKQLADLLANEGYNVSVNNDAFSLSTVNG